MALWIGNGEGIQAKGLISKYFAGKIAAGVAVFARTRSVLGQVPGVRVLCSR